MSLLLASFLASSLAASSALVAPDDPVATAPQPVEADATITAVTLYQGRAAVTREAKPRLAPGLWELRFPNLPPTTDAASLQASVPAPGKILDVRFEERPLPAADASNPEFAALEKEIRSLQATLAGFGATRDTLQATRKTLDGVAASLTASGDKGAAPTLEPEKLKSQLAFLRSERQALNTKLLALEKETKGVQDRLTALEAKKAAIGGGGRIERSGVVTFALLNPADELPVRLTYQATDATWVPRYALRAPSDLEGLTVEFDAVIAQRTGEDWNNVQLSLSTARPTQSANPPPLLPLFLSFVPEMRYGFAGAAGRDVNGSDGAEGMSVSEKFRSGTAGLVAGSEEPAIQAERKSKADRAAGDVAITQNATAATYVLPRTVSLPSDSRREQKTRIASIDLKPDYSYVTRPAADPAVFLRGKTRNDSPYQLLAGKASVFLGGDSIGQVDLPDVAPGADVELWFGADKRLAAQRVLVAKNASTSGLFSKSADTAWQYRIDLTSTLDKPANVEVWDRIPVSQDERVVVTLSDVLPPLAKDNAYEAGERKQGLLKWLVKLPPRGADRQPEVVPVRWNVKLAHPVDIATTPVPD